MVDAGATGAVEVNGSARPSESEMADCYDSLTSTESTRLVPALGALAYRRRK